MPLKYDVNHAHFTVGVPARDLTDEEVEQYGGKDALLGSGNYIDPAAIIKLPGVSQDEETAESEKSKRSKGA